MNKHIRLTDTLTLSDCKDGFWLYDKTRGMNLAMRSKTERDAFVEALTYYQRRLGEKDQYIITLTNNINTFLSKLRDIKHDPFDLVIEDPNY